MATNTAPSLPEGSILPAVLPPPSSSLLTSDKQELTSIAQQWFKTLQQVLATEPLPPFGDVFLENSYWRDHLCLSWDFRTLHRPSKIDSFFASHPHGVRIKSLAIDPKHEVSVTTLDAEGEVKGVQVYLTVTTDVGTGRGLARLFKDGTDGQWKAYTLYTVLEGLNGHEEPIGPRRPHGVAHGARESRLSWKDRRDAEVEFVDSEPTVLVVGMYYSHPTPRQC